VIRSAPIARPIPARICGNPLFHCSPAGGHDHPHYTNYASYELLDATDQVVVVGGKFGYCVEDAPCPPEIFPLYNCSYQGISVGCADEYGHALGCQYIDVTAIPNGSYTLRVTADPLDDFDESDETNNVALLPITIAKPREGDESMPGGRVLLESAPQYIAQPDPPKRLKFVANGPTPFDLPDLQHAPTSVGATLHMIDTGDPSPNYLFSLPSSGWRGLGEPAGSKGYRFRGSVQPGDCRSVVIKSSRVRATCQIVGGPFTPIAGDLELTLTTGDGAKRYCTRFGGTDLQNDAVRLRRKNAPALPCGG
jgi:hypothetical protein